MIFSFCILTDVHFVAHVCFLPSFSACLHFLFAFFLQICYIFIYIFAFRYVCVTHSASTLVNPVITFQWERHCITMYIHFPSIFCRSNLHLQEGEREREFICNFEFGSNVRFDLCLRSMTLEIVLLCVSSSTNFLPTNYIYIQQVVQLVWFSFTFFVSFSVGWLWTQSRLSSTFVCVLFEVINRNFRY